MAGWSVGRVVGVFTGLVAAGLAGVFVATLDALVGTTGAGVGALEVVGNGTGAVHAVSQPSGSRNKMKRDSFRMIDSA